MHVLYALTITQRGKTLKTWNLKAWSWNDDGIVTTDNILRIMQKPSQSYILKWYRKQNVHSLPGNSQNGLTSRELDLSTPSFKPGLQTPELISPWNMGCLVHPPPKQNECSRPTSSKHNVCLIVEKGHFLEHKQSHWLGLWPSSAIYYNLHYKSQETKIQDSQIRSKYKLRCIA